MQGSDATTSRYTEGRSMRGKQRGGEGGWEELKSSGQGRRHSNIYGLRAMRVTSVKSVRELLRFLAPNGGWDVSIGDGDEGGAIPFVVCTHYRRALRQVGASSPVRSGHRRGRRC